MEYLLDTHTFLWYQWRLFLVPDSIGRHFQPIFDKIYQYCFVLGNSDQTQHWQAIFRYAF